MSATVPPSRQAPLGPAPGRTITGRDALIAALLAVWPVVGLFLDGQAHESRPLESFFTPSHAVLYSGFAAGAGWVAWLVLRARRSGGSWRDALGAGLGLTVVGMLAFAAGGLGDLAWHTVFGIEADIEALLSPTHLLLLAAAVLMLSGPLRAAWSGLAVDGDARSKELWPAVLSVVVTTAVVAFFFQYLSAFERVSTIAGGRGDDSVSLGLASIFVTNAILMMPLLALVRRFGSPPPGTATLLFTSVAVLIGFGHGFPAPELIVAAFVGGAAADVLLRALRPVSAKPGGLWLAGGLLPLPLWAAYFVALALSRGVAWSPELWAGAIVLCGMSGLAFALLAAPSSQPLVGQREADRTV